MQANMSWALIAEMKGKGCSMQRSEQMSAAFIRKTPNYPLSHTVFHLLPGKQRLLIRKAALSTTSLAGDGVEGQMPASASESLHPEHHSGRLPGCWKLCPRPQGADTGPREEVCLGCHRCVGRALSPRTAEPPHLPHTQPAAPGNRGLVPQAEMRRRAGRSLFLPSFFLSLFSSKGGN